MRQEPIPADVGAYLEALVPPRHAELQAMEAEAGRTRFPIIGPAAGQYCYLMTRLLGAKTVFELGSGFGYSTAWFARAVRENGGGTVHHAVNDADLSARARQHLERLGLKDLVEFHVGEAVAALNDATGPFDLIFNDIDKAGYPASLPAITAKLRRGGLLLVDNLLWHGRVLDPEEQDADTRGVRELTRLIATDAGWISSVVPIRDGILVARRR